MPKTHDSKTGKGHAQTFLQRRHILSINNHQANASQQWDGASYLSGWLPSKYQSTVTAGKAVEKLQCLHCWRESEMIQSCGKQDGSTSKKLKTELPYDPGIPFLVIYQKDWKAGSPRNMCIPMVIITKKWRQPKQPLMKEWINNMWYIQWNTV